MKVLNCLFLVLLLASCSHHRIVAKDCEKTENTNESVCTEM